MNYRITEYIVADYCLITRKLAANIDGKCLSNSILDGVAYLGVKKKNIL